MISLPDREMVVAKTSGLTEDEARREWSKYAEKTVAEYGENILLGGKHWRRWLESYVLYSTGKRDRKAEERHRKALEDEAYRTEAVSFQGWMAILGKRKSKGEQIAPHEAEILAWYMRQAEPRPDGVSALMGFWADRARGPADPTAALDTLDAIRVDDAIAAERRAQSLLDLQHSDLLDGLGIEALSVPVPT